MFFSMQVVTGCFNRPQLTLSVTETPTAAGPEAAFLTPRGAALTLKHDEKKTLSMFLLLSSSPFTAEPSSQIR